MKETARWTRLARAADSDDSLCTAPPLYDIYAIFTETVTTPLHPTKSTEVIMHH